MPQARDEDGNIWETDAQGNPVRLISQGGGQQQMPVDPGYQFKGRAAELDVRGKEAGLGNDAARLDLDRQRFELQQRQAEAAAREAATKQGTTQARGGVDSTESERTAGFLATRLAGGLQDLSNIGNIGAPSLKDALVGGTLIGNYTTDVDRQRAINAQRDILDAALTLGTGAAYTKEQIEAYRASYFPQPGDAPETVKDKGVRLQRLLEASRLKAGASAGMIDEALSRANTAAPDPNADDPNNPGMTNDGSLSVRVTDDRPSAPTAPPTGGGDYRDSYAGQGMSGINEGIASTIGAPADLTALAMNLPTKGFNALTNSNLPMIENPVMGSEWIKDKLGGWSIYGQSGDRGKQALRRVGQSVGSAVVPLGAAPGTMSKALGALGVAAGGGAGAAAAQQAFPGNPVAEFTGEVLGSGLTAGGLLGSSRRAAVRKAIEQVPSRDQLRDQASNLYSSAESRGVVAGPNVTGNLAGQFGKIADDEKVRWPTGEVDPNYTRAGSALKMMDAHSGKSIDPKQIQVLRDNLMDSVRASEGKERRVASKMLDAFDAVTVPLAPELAEARGVASRYLQSDVINNLLENARKSSSSYSGSGYENALRNQFRSVDKKITNDKMSFAPAVEDAISQVNEGTRWSNAMRRLGKAAPTGNLSTGISAGVPFLVGSAFGGPTMGAAASGATMLGGTIAKNAAEQATSRYAKAAEVLARNGGPINMPPLIDDETRKALERALAGQGSQYIPR